MPRYEIGHPFPHPGFEGEKNAVAFSLTSARMEIVFLQQGVGLADINTFQQQDIKYGLYTQDNIPFMQLEYKGQQLSHAFNIQQQPERQVIDWLNSTDPTLQMFLVDSHSYILEGIRSATLDPQFLKNLKGILSLQKLRYPNAAAVDKKIHQLLKRIPSAQMTSKATRYIHSHRQ